MMISMVSIPSIICALGYKGNFFVCFFKNHISEELAECDQDEYIDFLNHLSNMNASACDPEIEVSSSEDEEDEDPEESAELRLTTSQTAVEE